MHDFRKSFFYPSLPRQVSAVALILTISGHFYILHLVGNIAVADIKNGGSPNEVMVRLLNDKTYIPAFPLEIEKQSERRLTKPEMRSLRPPPFDEIPISTQTNRFYYFKSDELSQKPQVVDDLPADFFLPDIAELPEPLVMTLRISNEGIVDEVIIAEGLGDIETVLRITAAFKSMTFTAAKIDDTAVPSEINIEVWRSSKLQDEQIDK